MKLRKSSQFATALLFSTVLVAGCGDDDNGTGPGGSNTVVGTWQATQFVVDGADAVPGGLSLQLTLTAGGNYTMVINGDSINLCGNDSTGSCTNTGPYSTTSTTFLFDAGDEDEAPFSYTLSSNAMTWSGVLGEDDTPLVVQFVRVS